MKYFNCIHLQILAHVEGVVLNVIGVILQHNVIGTYKEAFKKVNLQKNALNKNTRKHFQLNLPHFWSEFG